MLFPNPQILVYNALMHCLEGQGDNQIALYIHIPFCKKKCGYCSFVSFPGKEAVIPEYIKALEKELSTRTANKNIFSIYIGGGTPSLMSSGQISDILDCIKSLAAIIPEAEITMEANPGTVDKKYLAALRKTGVNRLSLGVQSFDGNELALLGRIHTANESREVIKWARQAGFDNLNIDLIYGLPGQKNENWIRTLREAVKISPEHISLYALTVEQGTPLFNSIKKGEISSPDPDIAADCYEAAEDILGRAGYVHYEISNWAKEGYQCRHNLVYWRCLPYIGIGVAAHSYLENRRQANTDNLEKYIELLSRGELPIEMVEEIDANTNLSESVILALRLSAGLSLQEVKIKFGVDLSYRYEREIDEMKRAGLLEQRGDNLRLSNRGRLLGNEVFQRFLP